MRLLDDAGLRLELKHYLAERGITPTEWAREMRITDEVVLSFLRGSRPAGPSIAKAMGLKRKMIYIEL